MKAQLDRLIAIQQHPELLALHALFFDAAQGLYADHIVCHVKVDILAHAHLKRVGVAIGIATVRHQTAFNALAKTWVARPNVPGLARFSH